MDLKTVQAWLAKNKTVVLGTAGVGVAGAALYAKSKGSSSGNVTPATTDAATVAADQGADGSVPTYGGDTGSSGLDSVISSDMDAEVAALQQLQAGQTASQGTLGRIASTITTVAKHTAPAKKPKPSTSGNGYVIAYNPKTNTYYGVTDKNVDVLHAAGVARHLKAGSQVIKVSARPVPVAAPRPAPKKAKPKPKPKVKKK